ncbi:putative protein TPRXL [Trematomus bernacchii]|uniref:putative protein TPRXL n=1 Tax=Trematomus bernacchii TaxID=40690 RepID=UPI00146B0DB1|nr:putative protein TPRXL [Trematomus bernacchii]
MRNLLVGVFLGLLAVVHSTPVHTTTQITAENEVIREALTDGYLVEQSLLPTLTTESPKRNTSVQQITDTTQESAKGESMDHISTSTILPEDTQDNISDSTTTPNPQLSFTSSEEPNEAKSGVTATHITVPQTTDLTTAFDIAFRSTLSSESGSGDGDGEMFTQYPTTTSSMTLGSGDGDGEMFTQYPTTTSSMTSGSGDGDGEMFTQDLTTTSSPSTSMADFIPPGMFAESEGSSEGSGSDIENSSIVPINETPSKQEPLINKENSQKLGDPDTTNTVHSTPGWIIIVGFIVGLAALIVLFVAIATRDKWNAPSQASKTKSSSSNQQREIEMDTFLHKDNPRENGTAGEYTVIPLEELPGPSSH